MSCLNPKGHIPPSVNSILTSSVVFACVLGGAVLGMFLRVYLPEEHLSGATKETVKLGMALVSTMSALVLGLLVSSAKTFYDTQGAELNQLSADVVVLDRLLAHYGPDTKDARDELRASVIRLLDRIWPAENTRPFRASQTPAPQTDASSEVLLDKIQALSPKDDKQRSLMGQTLSITVGVVRIRWLMYEQSNASVSKTLLVVMVFWLTAVFVSFGLFAPRNATAVAGLCAGALSVSGAIFLILEMYMPYSGLIQISSSPLRAAIEHLGH